MMAMSRSEHMARIKGKNTSPEKCLRSMLWARGLRFRIHAKTPVGRPDIVFLGARCAVFIDGCFWHGCPKHYVRPRTRHEFWAKKLSDNVERDRRQTIRLEEQGWTVLRFWEHEVEEDPAQVCANIEVAVRVGVPPRPASWRVFRVDALSNGRDEERRYLVDLRDATLRCAEEGPRYSRSGPRNPEAVRAVGLAARLPGRSKSGTIQTDAAVRRHGKS